MDENIGQVPDFGGDRPRSVEILLQMSQGIKATKDRLLSKGLISYKPPMLLVAYTGIAKNMSVIHTNDNGTDAVIIGANFLSNLSKLDFERIDYLNRPDGVPFFHGRVKDFAFLVGVEEAHHSSFEQYKKNLHPPSFDGNSMPMEQYDAIEHEYRALLFQYRIAIERQMPIETVSMLKKRIDSALAVRNHVA